MKDQRDGLPAISARMEFTPRPPDMAIMAPLVETGIKKALAQ